MSSREREYDFLLAELVELNRLLSMVPEAAVIDRISLEGRKEQVLFELDALPQRDRWPASAHLSFSGAPVVDGQGIFADFAGVAVDAFSKAVTSLAASQNRILGKRGVIPNQEDYRLLITGVSHGSFGFEIEEVLDEQISFVHNESSIELAIDVALGILESLVGDEEAIADAIVETDDRALDDLREFLEVLASNEAVCKLSSKKTAFSFRDVGQIRYGLTRLAKDNLHEGDEIKFGHFQGFLPKSRRAEFVVKETEEVISCRIDKDIEDAEAINQILNKEINVLLHFRSVGNSRPRYTVIKYNISHWEDWLSV